MLRRAARGVPTNHASAYCKNHARAPLHKPCSRPAGLLNALKSVLQAAEDTSSQIQDKIVYAEKAQDVEAARVRQLQGRVEEVKKTTAGDMDGVQGAGHAESMDMDDVRVCVCVCV